MAVNQSPSFGVTGTGRVATDFGAIDDAGYSVALQTDGKILVVGSTGRTYSSTFALARYNVDGSLDTRFNNDGLLTTVMGTDGGKGMSVTLQADGKILVAGYCHNGWWSDRYSYDYSNDFALVRYTNDGNLDRSFSGNGTLSTDFGADYDASEDTGYSVAIQADGKILVAGHWVGSVYGEEYLGSDFALARYNTDGGLDPTFSGDGLLTTDFNGNADAGYDVILQADGKILVAGTSDGDFALARYNANGSLDGTFRDDGRLTTDFNTSSDDGSSVTLQGDGKILVAGSSGGDFALVRYNTDGSLDTTFSGDGLLTTDFGTSSDTGSSVTLQNDGKILLAGTSNGDFALARYNTDGSLDASFDGDGQLTTVFPSSHSYGYSVTLQADGKILLAGSSDGDFALARYNTDGSLDTSFSGVPSTLGGTVYSSGKGSPVILDHDVRISDSDLSALGNFNGTRLLLARHGGANIQDRFDFDSSAAQFTVNGNALQMGGQTFANFSCIDGTLDIQFTGAASNATQAVVNDVMRHIRYENTSDTPPTSLQIDWSFNDGNSGAQGTGGAFSASGSTQIVFTAENDNQAPYFGNQGTGRITTDFGSPDGDYGYSVAVQTDGKILVVGSTGGTYSSAFALARYNVDGSLDASFSGDGKHTSILEFYPSYLTPTQAGRSLAVQADGKILVAGPWMDTWDYSSSIVLVRYNADSSLDKTFSQDGMTWCAIGWYSETLSDYCSVALQDDCKILLAGSNDGDFFLARYTSAGSVDASFSGDGLLTTDFSGNDDADFSVIMQTDGKILLAGRSDGDFALARYNTDGSLDSTFSSDGLLTTDFGLSFECGYSIAVQADGKILVAGSVESGSNWDFALARYNTDGSLDTTFSGDGLLTTDFGTISDLGSSVTLQNDGKILVAGSSNGDFALARYNTDGSLDATFSGDGRLTTDFGTSYDKGYSIAMQADGKILVAGYSDNGQSKDFALARYNTDGSLDTSFGAGPNALGGSVSYTENGAPALLDNDVQVTDAELGTLGNYNGTSLTLARHDGVNAQDNFAFDTNGAQFTVNGHELQSGDQTFATFSSGGGTLDLQFNGATTDVSQALVIDVMRHIAYDNSSDAPPASLQIDWTFDDGNSGAQGLGSGLTASGSTTVNIAPVNDAPVGAPTGLLANGVEDTAYQVCTADLVGGIRDPDGDSLIIGNMSGASLVTHDNGDGTWTLQPAANINGALTLDYEVSDGHGGVIATSLSLHFTPVLDNLTLYGTTGNDTLTGDQIDLNSNDFLYGLKGRDTLIGGGGADTLDGGAEIDALRGGAGNDTYHVENSGDVVTELAAQGADTVRANCDYRLPDNVENLVFTGTSGLAGYGNLRGNSISGNCGANSLRGLAGNDSLIGGDGADTLDGGTGIDALRGGAGDDTYFVENSGDVVTELAAQGTDTLRASLDYRLPDNVENLVFTGTSGLAGYGNLRGNSLAGNSSANILRGLAGNDTLIGGSGADTLVGGTGSDMLTGGLDADKFRFLLASEGMDTIIDFSKSQGDKLTFSSPNFGNLPVGALAASRFRANLTGLAGDANDRFIFETDTQILRYDADGNGAGAAVQIAKFNINNLAAGDIQIVAG